MAYVSKISEEEELKEYGNQLREHLIKQTQALDTNSFIVRQHWREIEKYCDPHAWNALSDLDVKESLFRRFKSGVKDKITKIADFGFAKRVTANSK
jgi:hypothetical protein